MRWIDVLLIVILAFSFLGGIKAGAINALFSLVVFIIAVTITGFYYRFVASLLSFLPGENWANFFGFLIAIIVVSIIISIICFIPRQFIRSIWNGGGFFSLVGGVLNVVNSAMGLVVFVFLLQAYPIVLWLNGILAESTLLTWLISHLDFIRVLLPETFRVVTVLLQKTAAQYGCHEF
jgi:uncharacterized membrane protein required for colicin V production